MALCFGLRQFHLIDKVYFRFFLIKYHLRILSISCDNLMKIETKSMLEPTELYKATKENIPREYNDQRNL